MMERGAEIKRILFMIDEWGNKIETREGDIGAQNRLRVMIEDAIKDLAEQQCWKSWYERP